jgi:hypothetical protein
MGIREQILYGFEVAPFKIIFINPSTFREKQLNVVPDVLTKRNKIRLKACKILSNIAYDHMQIYDPAGRLYRTHYFVSSVSFLEKTLVECIDLFYKISVNFYKNRELVRYMEGNRGTFLTKRNDLRSWFRLEIEKHAKEKHNIIPCIRFDELW